MEIDAREGMAAVDAVYGATVPGAGGSAVESHVANAVSDSTATQANAPSRGGRMDGTTAGIGGRTGIVRTGIVRIGVGGVRPRTRIARTSRVSYISQSGINEGFVI